MPEEPLTGIDEELRALLAVEPSPEFAVRVRERISREGTTVGSWLAAGAWATALAAALLAVGVGLWPSSEVSLSPPEHVAAARVPPGPAPIVEPTDGASAPSPAPNAKMAVRGRLASASPRRVASAPEPEVLVDARQTAGIQRLFELVRSGADLAPADSSALHAPIAVAPLRIPDLTIVDSPGPSVPPGGFVPNKSQPAKE
jgi:hypothetical protein